MKRKVCFVCWSNERRSVLMEKAVRALVPEIEVCSGGIFPGEIEDPVVAETLTRHRLPVGEPHIPRPVPPGCWAYALADMSHEEDFREVYPEIRGIITSFVGIAYGQLRPSWSGHYDLACRSRMMRDSDEDYARRNDTIVEYARMLARRVRKK